MLEKNARTSRLIISFKFIYLLIYFFYNLKSYWILSLYCYQARLKLKLKILLP